MYFPPKNLELISPNLTLVLTNALVF